MAANFIFIFDFLYFIFSATTFSMVAAEQVGESPCTSGVTRLIAGFFETLGGNARGEALPGGAGTVFLYHLIHKASNLADK